MVSIAPTKMASDKWLTKEEKNPYFMVTLHMDEIEKQNKGTKLQNKYRCLPITA